MRDTIPFSEHFQEIAMNGTLPSCPIHGQDPPTLDPTQVEIDSPDLVMGMELSLPPVENPFFRIFALPVCRRACKICDHQPQPQWAYSQTPIILDAYKDTVIVYRHCIQSGIHRIQAHISISLITTLTLLISSHISRPNSGPNRVRHSL